MIILIYIQKFSSYESLILQSDFTDHFIIPYCFLVYVYIKKLFNSMYFLTNSRSRSTGRKRLISHITKLEIPPSGK